MYEPSYNLKGTAIQDNGHICPQGMAVTPHHLATQSAVSILRDGGTAMEATIAAAATISVVYPHMNSIGGDSFWLIVPPLGEPLVIEACGAAGSLANRDFYKDLSEIPTKGPKSALTVAGTVGGWNEALKYVTECGFTSLPLSRLLGDAIRYAKDGYSVTQSQIDDTIQLWKNHSSLSFMRLFIPNGAIPKIGEKFYQTELGKTLEVLALFGLDDFYRGVLAESIAKDMERLGMPITLSDLQNYTPVRRTALKRVSKYGVFYNTPPPTQGLVSMYILGILEKLGIDGKHAGEFIHSTTEATKLAFDIRDKYITDPQYTDFDVESIITEELLSETSKKVNPKRASRKGKGKGPGDTIWLGVMDNRGFSVSFIQSIYHSFGSEVILPRTGILWHNRGIAFNLAKDHLLSLEPGKKPFHTLNPAAAKLKDGRVIVYGTSGGDGQGQTQAILFHRYAIQKLPLQKALTLPRWVFGRTVGDHNDNLSYEDGFTWQTEDYLTERGHKLIKLPRFSSKVGEAGMLVRHRNGFMEGAFDPRSNGSAAGY